jgi:large subunit ribosomal protein L2
MGKNLRQQRRGKGSPVYRSPGHRYLGSVSYEFIPADAKFGVVKDVLDAPGRHTPIAIVEYNGRTVLQIPARGMRIGQKVDFETPEEGNILELGKIPEGSSVFNLELHPRDGGRLCRSSGSFATVVTKEKDRCVVLMPSKNKKTLSARCRATIGIAAGGGRNDMPFRKAGLKHYAMKSFGRYYPIVSGRSKNAVDHPFGGSNLGKHKTVSRDMPPGKKVGSISPRRMGKKKRVI